MPTVFPFLISSYLLALCFSADSNVPFFSSLSRVHIVVAIMSGDYGANCIWLCDDVTVLTHNVDSAS